MQYCKDFVATTARLGELYGRRGQDRVYAVMKIPSLVLRRFAAEHPAGYCEYPDPRERIRFWDDLFQEARSIEDDHVPGAYLGEFDQGLYGALVGACPRFICDPATGRISSMVAPFLPDWAGLADLCLDESHDWYRRYREQVELFRQASRGNFGVSHLILVNSVNFLFEMRGATRTYLDLIDYPEMAAQAIEFAYRLNRWVADTFFDLVGLEQGGTCSNFAQWAPGRIVSESVDPFHMTSVDYFEQWGRAPIERIFADYDGGLIHFHANGRHLLPAAKTVKGLKAVRFLEDRGYPTAFELRHHLREQMGDVPLIMDADYEDFVPALARGDLPGGVLYHVAKVPDEAAANHCMDKVRVYRAPD